MSNFTFIIFGFYLIVGTFVATLATGILVPMNEQIRNELLKYNRQWYLPLFSFLMFMSVVVSWPFSLLSYMLGRILMSDKDE